MHPGCLAPGAHRYELCAEIRVFCDGVRVFRDVGFATCDAPARGFKASFRNTDGMDMMGKSANPAFGALQRGRVRSRVSEAPADQASAFSLCRWMWLGRHVLLAVILAVGLVDGRADRADALVMVALAVGAVAHVVSAVRPRHAGVVTMVDIVLLSVFAVVGLPAAALLTIGVVMLAWGATFRPKVAAITYVGVTVAVILMYTVGDRPPLWLSVAAFCTATAVLTFRAVRLNIGARTIGEHERLISRYIDAILWEEIPGRGLRVASSAERLFGYPAERWKDRAFLASIRHPDDPCLLTDIDSCDPAPVLTFRLRHADGAWRSCEAHVSAITDSFGRHVVYAGVLLDRTHQVAMESEVATLGHVVMTSPIPQILLTRSEGGEWTVTSVNAAADTMFEGADVVGASLAATAPDHTVLTAVAGILERPFEAGAVRSAEVTRPDGRVIEISARVVDAANCTVDFMDITDRVEAARLLYDQARRDDLTGLPNRRALVEHLTEILDSPDSGCVGLLSIDLDAFKEINDALGHETGDMLLRELANRIVNCRPSGYGYACRTGGDEFAVVVTGSAGEHVRTTASEISDAISQPVHLGELRLRVRTSIGIATAPADADTVDELIRRADVAMHRAKDNGGGVEVYEPHIDPFASGKLALIGDLEAALATDGLELHHQPVVDVATGRIVGTEALTRWVHPTAGVIPPAVFVGLAENSDQIRALTRWVIRRALQDLREIGRRRPDFTVSVNLSVRNLYEADLVRWIGDALTEYGIGPGRLIVEITEDSIMEDHAAAIEALEGLRAIGVGSWIDDFGTGHSSFARLRHLPVDGVKIDRSFVAEAITERERVVLRSMIELVQSLGLEVIVEGVETAGSLSTLTTFGADRVQGYHLGRPETLADLELRMAGQVSLHS